MTYLYNKVSFCVSSETVSSDFFFSGVWDLLSHFFACLNFLLKTGNLEYYNVATLEIRSHPRFVVCFVFVCLFISFSAIIL